MNKLNEELAIIRRQKAVVIKQMNNETQRYKKIELANKVRLLNKKEKELLDELGVPL